MKTVLLFLLFATMFMQAKSQIVLENTYPSFTSNLFSFSVVNLGYAGYKYLSYDPYQHTFTLYNLNHSLYKIIVIPQEVAGYLYISDNLFDPDSAIEYLAFRFNPVPYLSQYIYKEDGSILLSHDSLWYASTSGYAWDGDYNGIVSTDSGTKLIVHCMSGTKVYSLPGNLVCQQCTDGMLNWVIGINEVNKAGSSSLADCYPNPTDHSTTIDYSLPNGIFEGEIIVFDISGTEVKRFKVTHAFKSLNISTKDLFPGSYYYYLSTASGNSPAKI